MRLHVVIKAQRRERRLRIAAGPVIQVVKGFVPSRGFKIRLDPRYRAPLLAVSGTVDGMPRIVRWYGRGNRHRLGRRLPT